MTLMIRALTLLAALVLPAAASVASGQSLAGAARQENERRQGVKATSKVITNRDLKPAPPTTAADPAGDPGTAAAAPDAKGGAPDSQTPASAPDKSGTDDKDKDDKDKGDDGEAKGGTRDQQYWSERMGKLREQLRRDQTLADGMQSRINALTTDFVNRADPAQQAAIGRERTLAVDELTRLKKAIVDGGQAITDLEEEARRAGVPAGWLR